MRSKTVILGFLVLTLSLLLTACSNSTQSSRSAAPAETSQSVDGEGVELSEDPTADDSEISAEVSPTEEPSSAEESSSPTKPVGSDVSEESENETGSILCVRNDSSRTVVISAGLGEIAPREIAPGEEQCSENSNPFGQDIAGTLAIDGTDVMGVSVNNPIVGLGEVLLGQPSRGICVQNKLGRQGMKSSTKDDGLLRYQFERLTPFSLATQQIEFRLVLTDSSYGASGTRSTTCF